MKIFIELIKNFFTKPVTVDFPITSKGLNKPERLRGRHYLDNDICTGCKRCYRVCPSFVIEMIEITENMRHLHKNMKKKFTPVINLDGCIFCGACEDVCPTDALNLTNNIVVPSDNREKLKVK